MLANDKKNPWWHHGTRSSFRLVLHVLLNFVQLSNFVLRLVFLFDVWIFVHEFFIDFIMGTPNQNFFLLVNALFSWINISRNFHERHCFFFTIQHSVVLWILHALSNGPIRLYKSGRYSFFILKYRRQHETSLKI